MYKDDIKLFAKNKNGSPNLDQKTKPYNNQQQQKRELTKLWNLLSRMTTE